MSLTHHAKVRMQQRAIPLMLVDLLRDFGVRQSGGGGSSIVFFDKKARRQLRSYAGSMYEALNDNLDVYAVLGGDGQVITTGYRTQRIEREREHGGLRRARSLGRRRRQTQ